VTAGPAEQPGDLELRFRGRGLRLTGDPLLMGIVNTSPDSFSDPEPSTQAGLVERARELDAAGAALIDVGGESGRTDRARVDQGEVIARVVPVIEPLAAEGLLVSVDTWRAPVARAALAAGAAMVNDPSGLIDPEFAQACAETGAALVITHTRLPPNRKGFPPLRRRRRGRGHAAARAGRGGAPARSER
jgi:dihydropteroate synthase